MAENIVEINDLCVAAVKKNILQPVLDHVSFTIPQNKVTGIAGESGSGKTLTALSLIRLFPPGIKFISGNIRLQEDNITTDLTSLNKKALQNIRGKKISMIFQEPMTSLNPSLTCGFQVEEALMTHEHVSPAVAYEKVLHLFREVRLPNPENIYKAYPHQLSGGQRQRIMIAMALIPEPVLLIADEPTTALDVTVQKKILILLREIMANHKLSILFITHDLRLLYEFADHIVIMRNGRVLETGKSEDIFKRPVNQYTKGLIACQPPLTEKPARLITVQDFEEGKQIKYPSRKNYKRPTGSGPILSVKNVSVYFSKPGGLFQYHKQIHTAVNKFTLDIFPGETVGIVGESGCGKTSLGKAILNLLPETEGEIFFRNTNIRSLKGNKLKDFRKKIQFVFQDPYSSLNPLQTAEEIITEPMRVHQGKLSPAQRKERCRILLEKVGLPPDSSEKYPHQFSGGQRQRIGIARCLAVEPEMIILDESVSSLDVSVQAQILNLLNDLKDDFGLTYIFISHDLAVVRYMSDRIIVMKEGRMEEAGDAADICSNPVSDYTKTLIESIPGRY